jgi:uncharacterized protein YjlB
LNDPKLTSPETMTFRENGRMPNSDLPVLIYRRVLAGEDLEQEFRNLFHSNHWGGTWALGIYGYHHFHSNAHEVLGVAAGSATLLLGGEATSPIVVEKGDVIILPAGTGHRRIRDSWNFWVVGAYPHGQEQYDEFTDKRMCTNCALRLRSVEVPARDPVFGKQGSLVRLWTRAHQGVLESPRSTPFGL